VAINVRQKAENRLNMANMIEAMDGWTRAALSARIVRYDDLIPCYNAFVDCRTPGSEAKENFTIIGPGVSENPNQHVHIAEPHGYNIGGARQPVGCVNSQHSHDTAEVFVVHSGHWRFDLGEHGDDAQVELSPGDVISIPTNIFRGFTATAPADDGSPGFLWAVLGQDDPGRVTWAPEVFKMAKNYGLVLMENGSLVDTAAGQSLPDGVAPLAPTTREQADRLDRMDAAAAAKMVVRDAAAKASGPITIIGANAPLNWHHGFTMQRIDINTGDHYLDDSGSKHTQVLFIHRGSISIAAKDGPMIIGEGDTISLPHGFMHHFATSTGATVFAVSAL
jgi:mannose-6-phosphate isomerase-like protein (cupin superfamily)